MRYKSTKRKARSKLSSLEVRFMALAKTRGLKYEFEAESFEYIIKSKYTPDFKLATNLFIETKGLFDGADRRKMKAFKQQYPKIKVHMLFGNPEAKIRKGSKTTYAMWCKKVGIECADIRGGIPEKWLPKPEGESPFASSTSTLKRRQPRHLFGDYGNKT